MKNECWIADVLRQLSGQDLERRLPPDMPPAPRRATVDFSSNDYLGLRKNPDVIRNAVVYLQRFGTGAGASRLLSGSLACHRQLEELLARFKAYPSSLVFGSGYLANCGVIPALVGRGDLVVADRLVHASLVDSSLLSGARLLRFRHNDPEHLDALLNKSGARRKLVVTESVFSMDGDVAPLKEVALVAMRHGAMVFVDEAHATGIFGPEGSGLVRAQSICDSVNISMGTLSKALASYGGFVCCSSQMKDFLVNRARTFIYSTAPPPSAVGAAIAALEWLKHNPDAGALLLRRASLFRRRLASAGLNVGAGQSQIVPLIVGENQKALELAARLRDHGLVASAIRPPTVPPGTARIRFSITLEMSAATLEECADIVIKASQDIGLV